MSKEKRNNLLTSIIFYALLNYARLKLMKE